METRKKEEASKVSDGWEDEVIPVSYWLADPVCEWREILLLSLRISEADDRNDGNLHAV